MVADAGEWAATPEVRHNRLPTPQVRRRMVLRHRKYAILTKVLFGSGARVGIVLLSGEIFAPHY